MKQEPELDENGLVVQKFDRTVLVVVPPRDHADSTLRYSRSGLLEVDVATRVVSTQDEEPVHGVAGDEFQPDGLIRDSEMDGYVGVVFCGGPGARDLAEDPDAQRLAREALAQEKLIGAWGDSLAVLARAGVLERRKVTGDPALRETLTSAGARFTGAQVEVDGMLVTAIDDMAGVRFSQALAALASRPG
jgi:protease I